MSREIAPFSVSALTSAVRALGDRAMSEPPPSKDRLARLMQRISDQLSEGMQVIELSRSEWLDAPWLAFSRWGQHALCWVPAFRDGLSKAAQNSPIVAKRCILVFLRDYDAEAPLIGSPLGLLIHETLQSGHETLSAWTERNRQFRIFERDGGPAVTLARLVSKHLPKPIGFEVVGELADSVSLSRSIQKPLTRCLNEVGLAGQLAHGGFSFGMLLAWCGRAHERLWENQEIIEEWMTQCSGSMAGREYRVVECLLAPWRSEDPTKEWRAPLIAWLQERYGDPRDAVAGVWPQVNAELRAVAVRWLTLQTIEGFFEALDDYARRRGDDAMRQQWPFRKAFWLAYYRRGVVLDAKAAVGRDMEECLGWQSLKSRFGNRLAKLEKFESKQSALFLKLRGLVVFVGTHNAKCRLWDEASPQAPNLPRISFHYSEIIATPRADLLVDAYSNETGIAHMGAENGTWQRKLRDFLRQRIGVSIPDTELMP